MKILFSWVGHADLLGFGGDCPAVQEQVKSLIKKLGELKIMLTRSLFFSKTQVFYHQ